MILVYYPPKTSVDENYVLIDQLTYLLYEEVR